jgi:hypothetical protein
MPWYMAVLVRGSFAGEGLDPDRLGDLLYRLVQAGDPEAAYARATALGATLIDPYEDEGETLTLRFLGLADLAEVTAEELVDGVEVYNALLDGRPIDRVVEKTRLRVFETDENPADDEPEIEPERLGEPGNDAIEPR